MNCYLNATINSKLVLIIIFAFPYIQMVLWLITCNGSQLEDVIVFYFLATFFLTTAQLFWTDDSVFWMHIDNPILGLSST